MSGPWPGGVKDSVIFNTHLAKHLGDDEVAEADNGYRKLDKAVTPGVGQTHAQKKGKSQARGRHEIANGRIKYFESMSTRFRMNDPEKHQTMFYAITILVQISQENGQRLFPVEINGNYH